MTLKVADSNSKCNAKRWFCVAYRLAKEYLKQESCIPALRSVQQRSIKDATRVLAAQLCLTHYRQTGRQGGSNPVSSYSSARY